jgi:thiamine pyrophosphate-dependent acetolactate synthase large subunit-like protein
MPEFLTCMHEESAVAMGHGYFKVSGKPLMTLCHGTVGLQHAAMAIYNAWCDRVPMIVIGGNDLDASTRPPSVPTFHAAQDINALVRDFTKWDDTPVSLQHFAQSMVRAYKIAMTPPYGPVMIALDAGLQQEPAKGHGGDKLYIPRYVPTAPPAGDGGAGEGSGEAPRRGAEPGDRRRPHGAHAERHQAAGAARRGAAGARHRPAGAARTSRARTILSASPSVVQGADVILGLELADFWNTVNSWTDNGEHGVGRNSSRIKQGTKLISINASDLITKSNYQDFQRFQVIDVQMAADAEATLPALIEAVRSAIPAARRSAIAQRGEAAKKAHAEDHARTRQAAALGWDASPISTARLCMETYNAVKSLDWSIVSQSGNVSNWLTRLWPIEQHHHWLGPLGRLRRRLRRARVGRRGARQPRRRAASRSTSRPTATSCTRPACLWTAAKHKIRSSR